MARYVPDDRERRIKATLQTLSLTAGKKYFDADFARSYLEEGVHPGRGFRNGTPQAGLLFRLSAFFPLSRRSVRSVELPRWVFPADGGGLGGPRTGRRAFLTNLGVQPGASIPPRLWCPSSCTRI